MVCGHFPSFGRHLNVVLHSRSFVRSSIGFYLGFANNPERHFELLRLLGAEFGDLAFIRPWDSQTNAGDLTIRTLDQNHKQVIILYNDKNVIEGKSFCSPSRTTFTTSSQSHLLKALCAFHLNGLKLNRPFPSNQQFHKYSVRFRLWLHWHLTFVVYAFQLQFQLESQLIWPSWRMFTTANLRKNQLFEYIRKIFSKKFEHSPKAEPWIMYGIQGVDVSYVS